MLFGSETDVLMSILKFDVVSTSKFPQRASGDKGSLFFIHCCAETTLSRTMINISYNRYKNVFSDDIISLISIKQTSELL